MKIISPFKDYYDYLATQYGIDNSLVYVRKDFESDVVRDQKLNLKEMFAFNRHELSDRYRYRYLVVLGKFYLVVRKCPQPNEIDTFKWEIFDAERHDILKEANERYAKYRFYYGRVSVETLTNYFHQGFVELSKIIQQPIFFIDTFTYSGKKGCYEIKIEREMPNLANLGMPHFYSAEQLYQDLEYFLMNTMKDNPDIIPPVNVSDKDMIVAKGFDIKTSFRKGKTKNA